MSLPKCLGALECYEDCILFGAGVYGLIVLIKNGKQLERIIKENIEYEARDKRQHFNGYFRN